MDFFNNNWDKISPTEINNFIAALNNLPRDKYDLSLKAIEEFMEAIGYPIIYDAVGHYNEYIAATSENLTEIEEYIFSYGYD